MVQSPAEKRSPFRPLMIILISLLIATFCWLGATVAFSGGMTMFAGKRPTDLGVKEGKLTACPNTPNCVSSQSQDAVHTIEPLTFNSTPAEAMTQLKKVIEAEERTKIISETTNYLYAEFTSKLMGFVDDVEFYLDAAPKIIHVRSASRLGQSDLGVNRKRIETIRTKFNELQNK